MKHSIHEIAEGVRAKYADVRLEVHEFPSGSAMLDVWFKGKFFVCEFSVTHRQFGVDEVGPNDGFNSGYNFGAATGAETLAILLRLMHERTSGQNMPETKEIS